MYALKLWYWLALSMHFLLAFVHGLNFITPLLGLPPAFEGILRALQMISVIFETINFALMLTLSVYMTKELKFDEIEDFVKNTELATFRRWLTIEAVMFSITVLSNILVCLFRTYLKDYIQVDIDGTEVPESLDFLRSETTQNLTIMMAIVLFPLSVVLVSRYDKFGVIQRKEEDD